MSDTYDAHAELRRILQEQMDLPVKHYLKAQEVANGFEPSAPSAYSVPAAQEALTR